MADLTVSTKQVERLTRRIGDERCAERDAAVQADLALPLAQRKAVPAGVTAPPVAAVQMDGGRLQILDRRAAATEVAAGRHWREDKVGLLAAMTSAAATSDPCPTIPALFVDAARMQTLTQEIKGFAGVNAAEVAAEVAAAGPVAEPASAPLPSVYEAPKLASRRVIATRGDVEAFGPMLAQAAWEQGFYGAPQRAFLADGSNANWGVWRRHFSNFEPIVDFVHALTYVFAAAMAGRPFAVGWAAYTEWIGWLWAGQLDPLVAALAARHAELGDPDAAAAATSPAAVVAGACEYLSNQRSRMKYAEYRTAGLPITSSHVESTIKQVNRRVKGTEKFWSEAGAEAILQLRADTLSDGDPLTDFWHRRQARATGQRNYTCAA